MDKQIILDNLKAIVAPMISEPEAIDGQTELVADLGLDSVQIMDLLMQIEDRFDISIPLNVVSDVVTLDDLCVQIQHLLDTENS